MLPYLGHIIIQTDLTKRFGTPRSSEIKRPTINKRREGWTSLKTTTIKHIAVLGTTVEIKDPTNLKDKINGRQSFR
tara:strand:- start:75 stop:302 length:228 start_codon:yes stop_codon:yes gene_type:complete